MKTGRQKIATSKLNEVMLKATEAYHAPVVRGHPLKIKYVTQLPTVVPSFAFFCNYPDDVKAPYKNYLENQLREHLILREYLFVFFLEKSKSYELHQIRATYTNCIESSFLRKFLNNYPFLFVEKNIP